MKLRPLLLVLVFYAFASRGQTPTRPTSSLRWTKDPAGGSRGTHPLDAGLQPVPDPQSAPTERLERTAAPSVSSGGFRDPGFGEPGTKESERAPVRDHSSGPTSRRLRPLWLGVALGVLIVTGGVVGIAVAEMLSPTDGTVVLDDQVETGSWEVGVEPEPWNSDVDWAALVMATEEEEAAEEEAAAETELTGGVAAAQERLAELRYYVGPIDGQEGPQLQSALMAFQKVHGLSADGVLGPATFAALETPRQPTLRGGEANRVEVDLSLQVLYLVKSGQLERILPVSSGNGATYQGSNGGTAVSLTPVGTYRVERRIRGLREAPLGSLYDPLYFYRGWAIHGSNSVPAYPASHGCVRVTRWDATWLFDRVPNGTQVILYGGSHVFTAGSDAPGTDTPAGDTPGDTDSDPSSDGSDNQPAPGSGNGTPTPAPTASEPKAGPQPTTPPTPTATPEPTTSPPGSDGA